MTKMRQAVGKWGEEPVPAYLSQKGYAGLGRDMRTPHGGIDLVRHPGGLVILDEVRTRTSAWLGLPEESVNARKQAPMLACAEFYGQQKKTSTPGKLI